MHPLVDTYCIGPGAQPSRRVVAVVHMHILDPQITWALPPATGHGRGMC